MAMITASMMNLKILIDHYKKKESLVRGFSFLGKKNTPDNNQERFFLIMSIGFQLYNLFGRADILSFGYSGCRPNDNIFPCTFTSYHIKKENSICAEPGECIFFTMYDTYHPADFAAEGRLCSKYLPKSKSILDVKHYAVCGLFCIQILSREVRCFYFLSYY